VLAQAVGGIFNDPTVGLTSVVFYVSHCYPVQAPKVTGCTIRSHSSEQFWNRILEDDRNISLQYGLAYMIIVI
jgi:hypothetical protein